MYKPVFLETLRFALKLFVYLFFDLGMVGRKLDVIY